MASACTACGVENTQDSNFCRVCGAKLVAVPCAFAMSWHEAPPLPNRLTSRTASQNSLLCCSEQGSIAASTKTMTRNDSSFALLMRLQAAGPDWRDVDGLSAGASRCASPDASPKSRLLAAKERAGFPAEEEAVEDQIAPSQRRWGAESRRFAAITELRRTPPFPRILCVSRRYLRKNKYVDITGEFHIDLIQQFGGVPIILPRTTRTVEQLCEYLPMDGLVIAEGNDLSDDILRKYGCSLPDRLEGEAALKWAGDTELDVSKDELEFALMRFALAAGVPIMSFCRGSQMLNCLRGGTLIGDIESQTESRISHLRDAGDPEYDSFRHPISVEPDTPLAEWFADSLPRDGPRELLVNSYHHQASKTLGPGLAPMAHAPDGLIEGFYDPSYDPRSGRFVVGLQFHPERMLGDYPGCSRCYESFLEACRAYKAGQDAGFA